MVKGDGFNKWMIALMLVLAAAAVGGGLAAWRTQAVLEDHDKAAQLVAVEVKALHDQMLIVQAKTQRDDGQDEQLKRIWHYTGWCEYWIYRTRADAKLTPADKPEIQ